MNLRKKLELVSNADNAKRGQFVGLFSLLGNSAHQAKAHTLCRNCLSTFSHLTFRKFLSTASSPKRKSQLTSACKRSEEISCSKAWKMQFLGNYIKRLQKPLESNLKYFQNGQYKVVYIYPQIQNHEENTACVNITPLFWGKNGEIRLLRCFLSAFSILRAADLSNVRYLTRRNENSVSHYDTTSLQGWNRDVCCLRYGSVLWKFYGWV